MYLRYSAMLMFVINAVASDVFIHEPNLESTINSDDDSNDFEPIIFPVDRKSYFKLFDLADLIPDRVFLDYDFCEQSLEEAPKILKKHAFETSLSMKIYGIFSGRSRAINDEFTSVRVQLVAERRDEDVVVAEWLRDLALERLKVHREVELGYSSGTLNLNGRNEIDFCTDVLKSSEEIVHRYTQYLADLIVNSTPREEKNCYQTDLSAEYIRSYYLKKAEGWINYFSLSIDSDEYAAAQNIRDSISDAIVERNDLNAVEMCLETQMYCDKKYIELWYLWVALCTKDGSQYENLCRDLESQSEYTEVAVSVWKVKIEIFEAKDKAIVDLRATYKRIVDDMISHGRTSEIPIIGWLARRAEDRMHSIVRNWIDQSNLKEVRHQVVPAMAAVLKYYSEFMMAVAKGPYNQDWLCGPKAKFEPKQQTAAAVKNFYSFSMNYMYTTFILSEYIREEDLPRVPIRNVEDLIAGVPLDRLEKCFVAEIDWKRKNDEIFATCMKYARKQWPCRENYLVDLIPEEQKESEISKMMKYFLEDIRDWLKISGAIMKSQQPSLILRMCGAFHTKLCMNKFSRDIKKAAKNVRSAIKSPQPPALIDICRTYEASAIQAGIDAFNSMSSWHGKPSVIRFRFDEINQIDKITKNRGQMMKIHVAVNKKQRHARESMEIVAADMKSLFTRLREKHLATMKSILVSLKYVVVLCFYDCGWAQFFELRHKIYQNINLVGQKSQMAIEKSNNIDKSFRKPEEMNQLRVIYGQMVEIVESANEHVRTANELLERILVEHIISHVIVVPIFEE